MELMTTIEFVDKVKTMRDAQKEYFNTRSRSVLEKCKQLEREVDAEIARLQMKQRKAGELVGLFD